MMVEDKPMRNILKRVGHGIAQVKLGDMLSNALGKVGITEDRVKAYLGHECGCKERREKMNRITAWAGRVLAGEEVDHKEELEKIVNPEGKTE